VSYIIPSSAASVEVMKWEKTDDTGLPNLPYTINVNSLVDVGSPDWEEVTDTADHPSMTMTNDFGVKFEKTGYYRIDWGIYLYGTAPVSGTTGVIIQYIVSTTSPNPLNAGYWPTAGQPSGDVSYNRFDNALANNQVLAQAPDFNNVLKIESEDTTIYFYVKGEGLPTSGGGQFQVRVGTAGTLNTLAVTRIGDL